MKQRVLAVTLLSLFVLSVFIPQTAWAAPQEEPGLWDRFVSWWEGDDEKKEAQQNSGRTEDNHNDYGKMGDLLVDNIIPNSTRKTPVEDVEVIPYKYPPSRYQLDIWIEDRYWLDVTDDMAGMWHGVNNGLWQVNVTFANTIYWLLDEFQHVNLVTDLSKDVENGIQTLAGFNGDLSEGQGIWGMMFPLMLLLAGVYVGWKAIGQNDEMTAKQAAIRSLVVIFFSFAYMTYASAIISTPANIVMSLRNGIMAAGATVFGGESYTPAEATAASINNLHKVMIDNDFRMLEWGTTQVDSKRLNAILGNPIESQARKKAVQQEATSTDEEGYGNKNMTPQANFIRTGFILGSFIKNLVIGFVVGVLAASGYAFQIIYLLVALMAPLALVWAVNPQMIESAENWAAEGLGALMMMFSIGVVLAIYFIASDLLYDWAVKDGFLKIVISQLVLIGIMIWRRDMLFKIATAPAAALVGFVGSADVIDNAMGHASKWLKTRNHYRRQREMWKKNLEDFADSRAASGSFNGPDTPDDGTIEPELVEAERVYPSLYEETSFEPNDTPAIDRRERPRLFPETETAATKEQTASPALGDGTDSETMATGKPVEPVRPSLKAEPEKKSQEEQEESEDATVIPQDWRTNRPSLYSIEGGKEK
ncbi:hypothetical protein GCM10011571_32710 [Marinithermofilum abyssi]|uniref:TrbL/VirB6 plasmid conjugal transfer protein n=1 Tax=Marinithermofilum abyssi TaxID=1571185 RepID=A0A8J2VM27_9BACL|nr:hypothetical protein [Marinithermofilum abyssi]GGE28041.1 hypothetical protein GCM10011571_32710 [Marinithermofilum abyssi]